MAVNSSIIPTCRDNWCKHNNIRYTRGRPYKKNDQAHAEQKNWSAVRRMVGYDRYATKAAYKRLQMLYSRLNVYINFFQPIRKVVGKERVEGKVRKRYDIAQTPYHRLPATGVLQEDKLKVLDKLYHSLNPVELLAQINTILEDLWKLAERPQSAISPSKQSRKIQACGSRQVGTHRPCYCQYSW